MGNDITTIARAADTRIQGLENRLTTLELERKTLSRRLDRFEDNYVSKKGLADILVPIRTSITTLSESDPDPDLDVRDDVDSLSTDVVSLRRIIDEQTRDLKELRDENRALRQKVNKLSEITAEIATDLAER